MSDEIIEIEFGKDRFHQQNEMIQWCKHNLGEGGWGGYNKTGIKQWAVESMFGNTFFYFRNPNDAFMFKLMWG